MAKKAAAQPRKKVQKTPPTLTRVKVKVVEVPAGEKAYITENGGMWPIEVKDAIERAENIAYDSGVQDGIGLEKNRLAQQTTNCSPRTVHETIALVLGEIKVRHMGEQNQVIAVVLNELNNIRAAKVDDLTEKAKQADNLLSKALEHETGLKNILSGGLENLAIS